MLHVYCDGGVIGSNPSTKGGTWAYVLVRDDSIVYTDCGIVYPKQCKMHAITNNLTEMLAALNALETVLSMKEAFHLYSDSQITLNRLYGTWAWNNIPENIHNRVKTVLHSTKLLYKGNTLVAGHPTVNDLERGYNHKNQPVSKYNVLCDKLCTQKGKEIV